MRTLSEEEQKMEYSKYYAMTLFPPPHQLKTDIESRKIDPEYMVPLERREIVLDAHVEKEYIGYGYLEDRFGYVSTVTYMPNVTPEMIDWWFVWHGQEESRYGIWDKEDHYYVKSDKLDRLADESIPMKERIIGVTHHVLEDTGTGPEEIVIQFQDPKDLFTPAQMEKSGVQSVIWANGSTAVMCHTVFADPMRKGVVLTSHFWIGYNLKNGEIVRLLPDGVTVPEPVIRGLALHSIKEYSNLGHVLPYLYAEVVEGKQVVLEPMILTPPGERSYSAESFVDEMDSDSREVNEIVDAAIRIARAMGTSEIPLSKVDEELGKEPGYVYNYFPSQWELNEKCTETMENHMIREVCRILTNQDLGPATRVNNLIGYLTSESDVIDRLEYGHYRNIENAAKSAFKEQALYQKLTEAYTVFIEDGNKAGLFFVDNPRARAAFMAHGMMGLRAFVKNEKTKVIEFQKIFKEVFGL
jgi:hypothetical protein